MFPLVIGSVQVADDLGDRDKIAGIDFLFIFLGAARPHCPFDTRAAFHRLQDTLPEMFARVFPDRLHHPDEERYVFEPLRTAAPDHKDMIDTIRAEHDRADTLTMRLYDAVQAFDRGDSDAEVLRHSIQNYLEFQFEHMSKEENASLPLVEQALDADTYQAASKAFAGHTDPLFADNLAAGFDVLRRRIEAHA